MDSASTKSTSKLKTSASPSQSNATLKYENIPMTELGRACLAPRRKGTPFSDVAILRSFTCESSERAHSIVVAAISRAIWDDGTPFQIKWVEFNAFGSSLRPIRSVTSRIHTASVQIVICCKKLIAGDDGKKSAFERLLRSLNPDKVITVLPTETEALGSLEQDPVMKILAKRQVAFSTPAAFLVDFEAEFCKIFAEQLQLSRNVRISSRSGSPYGDPISMTVLRHGFRMTSAIRVEMLLDDQSTIYLHSKTVDPASVMFWLPESIPETCGPYVIVNAVLNDKIIGCKRIKYTTGTVHAGIIGRLAKFNPNFLEYQDKQICSALETHADLDDTCPEFAVILDELRNHAPLFPTAIHLAAFYGLQGLTAILLERGQFHKSVLNCLSQAASDTAIWRGHHTVGNLILEHNKFATTQVLELRVEHLTEGSDPTFGSIQGSPTRFEKFQSARSKFENAGNKMAAAFDDEPTSLQPEAFAYRRLQRARSQTGHRIADNVNLTYNLFTLKKFQSLSIEEIAPDEQDK